jgi:hypothetical protein
LGGEAGKTQFHFDHEPSEPLEPDGPGAPNGVGEPVALGEPLGLGVWGLLTHMLLMIPLVPPTIINVLATFEAGVYVLRALGAPGHRTEIGRAHV